MKKFCPNCGKPLDKDSKFCSFCGQNLVQEANDNVIKVQVPAPKAKKSNKIWWITGIFVALILIVAGGFFYYYQNNQRQDIEAVNKMPKKKLAGLTIVYAHEHYHNDAWNKTYQEAMKGQMLVEQHKRVTINGATITAKGDNYVYVINNRVVFTTDKNNSDSNLILSDGKKTVGQVNTVDAYKQVEKQGLKDLEKINSYKTTVPPFPVRKLAIMAELSHDPSGYGPEDDINRDYKKHIKNLYYEDGYYIFQMGADGAGMTKFKCEGQEIIIKYLDIKAAANAADAPEKTIRVDLNDLLEKYYQTADQKKYVDKLAQKLVTNGSNE